ncbi:MAG: SGNH/GDSL hydrolase family protein [Ignavibacterium sp.]|nr:SGNH/GDSL hydrolase family protein [Ignavibacterium sp.]MCX7611413.1 SGNH/GDSL hydrolase family protein [Ignavibacterium sp.]MDW8375233.1 SGNH/GDSL hydrolase family protein [Ignavibacteriales bacterium]
MKKLFSLIALLISLMVFYSCEDRTELTAPPSLNGKSGDADLTNMVSLGNSLTAGYQNGTLYISASQYAYPYLIAKQAGVQMSGLAISDPGLGGRLEVKSLSPFTLFTNTRTGAVLNSNFPKPFQNLGIPGALAYDVLSATNSTNCASALAGGSPNQFFDLILRNGTTGTKTPIQLALEQNPTFITLWIGNNDVLGYATSGGVSPSAPTPVATFQQIFNGIANAITAAGKQGKGVVANIPSVTAIPFFTTVGPQIALSTPWTQLRATGVTGLVYQRGTGVAVADSASLLLGRNLVTLRGSSYAPLLGQRTGKYYRDLGISVPAGIDTSQPFGFHPQNPWPNALILDSLEINTTNTAINNFNNIISNFASSVNFGLVDINKLFRDIRQNDFTGGTAFNGRIFTTTFVTGGLFSLDGVHPTNQGQAIIANEFIKVINSKFNAKFPLVDVSAIPGSLIFAGKINFKNGYPIIPIEALNRLLF